MYVIGFHPIINLQFLIKKCFLYSYLQLYLKPFFFIPRNVREIYTQSRLASRSFLNSHVLDRSSSNTSLNNINEDGTVPLSESDQKEYKDRRKSLSKRLKKKAISLDPSILAE